MNTNSKSQFSLVMNEETAKTMIHLLTHAIEGINDKIEQHKDEKLEAEVVLELYHSFMPKNQIEAEVAVQSAKKAKKFLDHYGPCVANMISEVEKLTSLLVQLKKQAIDNL